MGGPVNSYSTSGTTVNALLTPLEGLFRDPASPRIEAAPREPITQPRLPRLFVALFKYWWYTPAIWRLQRMGY